MCAPERAGEGDQTDARTCTNAPTHPRTPCSWEGPHEIVCRVLFRLCQICTRGWRAGRSRSGARRIWMETGARMRAGKRVGVLARWRETARDGA
eukprot:6161131-Pleurochrysis_carterae.AAC.1